ncbi:MAG: hypothetical protein IPP60_08250 [Sphingobacteriales bacterium]|nr:hypothetical protein [Sphingobacteriales bacterium]
MNRFDFYKELYFKEEDRKKSLNDALTLPIGIVSAQIALLSYFYSNYVSKGFASLPIWSKIFFILTIVSLLICILFLIFSYFELRFKKEKYFIETAFRYNYIGSVIEFEDYYIKKLNYYNETIQTANSASLHDLEENIISNFIESIAHNVKLNDKKTKRISNAKLF